MIRRHDDDRRFPRAARFQGGAHATELVVDLGDHPVVLGPHPSEAVFFDRCGRLVDGEHQVVQVVTIIRSRDRHRNLRRVVHRRVRPRRAVRRMGPQITEMREPTRGAARDPREERVGEEARHAVLGGSFVLGRQQPHMAGRDVVALVGQPPRPLCVVSREVERDVEARQHAFIGPETGVVGSRRVARVDGLVGVAEQHRHVTGPTGSQRHVVEPPVERRPVAQHPMVHLVHPRVQRGTTRRTRRGLAVVTRQQRTVGPQRVEMRCLHEWVADRGQAIPPELIEGDQKNVRPHAPILPRRTTDVIRLRRGCAERFGACRNLPTSSATSTTRCVRTSS